MDGMDSIVAAVVEAASGFSLDLRTALVMTYIAGCAVGFAKFMFGTRTSPLELVLHPAWGLTCAVVTAFSWVGIAFTNVIKVHIGYDDGRRIEDYGQKRRGR